MKKDINSPILFEWLLELAKKTEQVLRKDGDRGFARGAILKAIETAYSAGYADGVKSRKHIIKRQKKASEGISLGE